MCLRTDGATAIFITNHLRRMQKYPTVAESNWRANTRASLGSIQNRKIYLCWPQTKPTLEKVPPNPLQSVKPQSFIHVFELRGIHLLTFW